jgi:hypothetical protein
VNFSALYLSLKRLGEVVDRHSLDPSAGVAAIAFVPTDRLQRAAVAWALEEATLKWLSSACLPTLGELIVTGKLDNGTFFTHYGPFYGKGILDSAARFSEGKPPKAIPELRARLESFSPKLTLKIQVHPQNYASASSAGDLSGRNSLFIVARLTASTPPHLEAQAYAIGHIHEQPRPSGLSMDRFGRLQWQMEVFLRDVDTFAEAADLPAATSEELQSLARISEADLKQAFAEVVGESFVPKDWGGERSDLFSTHVTLQGQSVATAFAFKGPAKYKPLTVADLGKNGDQISRLFSEPADFVILQHCHQITSPVRDHMRAFATRIGRLRPFSLIDGADTLRVLKAYRKLGFRQVP